MFRTNDIAWLILTIFGVGMLCGAGCVKGCEMLPPITMKFAPPE